jgi:hypothetical protein
MRAEKQNHDGDRDRRYNRILQRKQRGTAQQPNPTTNEELRKAGTDRITGLTLTVIPSILFITSTFPSPGKLPADFSQPWKFAINIAAMKPHDRPIRYRDCSLKYLEDIALVEEILPDGTRLFPHTGQMPLVSKAVDREFLEALPRHYAITDQRGDDQRKIGLHHLAGTFSIIINACRQDELLLLAVYRRDCVTRIAALQRVAQPQPKGTHHTFHLYVEGRRFPDIFLSGKRVAFASHVFERFHERAVQLRKTPVALLLDMLLSSPAICMRVNHRASALVFRFPMETILALPFEEHADHFFFTTCLTTHEIHDLQPAPETRPLDFHYGSDWPATLHRYFDPTPHIEEMMTRWRRQTLPDIPREVYEVVAKKSWMAAAQTARLSVDATWIPGHRLFFLGNFHSCAMCHIPPEDPCPPPLDPLP